MEFRPILHLIVTCIVALKEVQSVAVLPDLSSYNPLMDEGFVVLNGWKHYTTPRTTVVGSAADLMKGEICERVIAFSALGAVFDYRRTTCDALDPRIGLLEAFGALWYYKDVLARQESEDTYNILFRTKKRTCNKKTYTIKTCSHCGSPNVGGIPEVSVERNNDHYCNLLADFLEPMMKFLSSHSLLGTFIPKTEWAVFNIWEPLGAVSRLYEEKGGKVLRLLVLTSYGRVVEKLKVTGGPIQGMVLTDEALYYGNVAMVKLQGVDMKTFTTLYNPNHGKCIKRTVTLSSRNGRISRNRSQPEYIPEFDPECQDLINRKVRGAVVPESQLVKLRIQLADGEIDVKPFENGMSLQGREQMPGWNDINLNQELGFVLLPYKPDGGEQICQIVMLAKGVPLAGILKGFDPSKVVARKNALYHDTDIMVKKGGDENSFIVITRQDGDTCSEKTFLLKSAGGKMVKEEKSDVKKTKEDRECKDLIEGNKLKNPKAAEYGAIVYDDVGIIASVDQEVDSTPVNPQDEEL